MTPPNVPNFFKDFVRSFHAANADWQTTTAWSRGYTAEQAVGNGECFRFIPVASGQSKPFPKIAPVVYGMKRNEVETLSIPKAFRVMSRFDEMRLTQIAVEIRLVESFLALFSSHHFTEIEHLQMGVKGGPAEIDALYFGMIDIGGTERGVVVTLEAKLKDDILEGQILRQALHGLQLISAAYYALPLAIKAVKAADLGIRRKRGVSAPSIVEIVEFDLIARPSSGVTPVLGYLRHDLFELKPFVPGISKY